MSVTVYGTSDDLIEVEGDVEEEFNPANEAAGELLVASTGDVIRIRYSDQGVWRIEVVAAHHTTITQAPENDEENYSDLALIEGDVKWVVCANRIEFAKERVGEA